MRDWRAVMEEAEWHGVLPVLSRWLAAGKASLVPPDIAAEVRHVAHGEALRGLALAAELATLVHALDGAGIPVITLKGPALAVRATDDVAMRPPGDLDLLVHAADAEKALGVLGAIGYSRFEVLSVQHATPSYEAEYHYGLTNSTGVVVQLHWGIVQRPLSPQIQESFWWALTRRVPVAGIDVSALGIDAMLIYLAIHGGKHEWRHLRWIGDIAAVARHPSVDWPRVRAAADRLGAVKTTRLALALAVDILEAELPDSARSFAHGDPSVAPLVWAVRDQLASGERARFLASTNFQLQLRDSLGDKAAYTVRFAIAPEADVAEVAALPATWRSLYHLLSPVRVARRWGRRAMRLPA